MGCLISQNSFETAINCRSLNVYIAIYKCTQCSVLNLSKNHIFGKWVT